MYRVYHEKVVEQAEQEGCNPSLSSLLTFFYSGMTLGRKTEFG